MRRFLLLLTALTVLAAAPAAASLYSAEVAVDPQSPRGSAEQLRALDRVLARLTGRFDGSLVSELGLAAADLDELVLSQQLVRRNVIDVDGEPGEQLRLRVDFDEPSINALMRERDLRRWGRERPAILLWAAVEDAEGTRFLASPRLEYIIRDQAQRVGLEIVRPLRDAMDLAEISVQDVRGGFLGSAEASASRYGAEAVAMLDLRQVDDASGETRWSGNWRWRLEDRESGLSQTAASPEALIRSGIERLASSLAARYAVADTDGRTSRWQVTVDGIVDEVQYAEVLAYLGNLSVVETLRVVSAEDRRVRFEIETGAEDIASFLALGGLLELQRRGPGEQLEFRLAR